MLHLNKSALSIIITLFIYCNTYTITPLTPEVWIASKIDTSPYNCTIETSIETITSYTITHENRIMLEQDYFNRETGEIGHRSMQIYPDDSLSNNFNSFDTNLSHNHSDSPLHSNNTDSSGKSTMPSYATDWQDAHSKQSREESCKQEALEREIHNMENNQTIRTYNTSNILNYLNNLESADSLITALSSPIISTHIQKTKYSIADKESRKSRTWFRKKTVSSAPTEIKFCDALISGKITQLLRQIQHHDLSIAKTAFAELRELWPWKREHTFLTASFVDGSGEHCFITKLGVDIMRIAEKTLIARQDYIIQHTDAQSSEAIQKYREYCSSLQQKGNRCMLSNEEIRLHSSVFKNGKNDDFVTNVCYAIAEKAYRSPITTTLHNIVKAPSLEKSLTNVRHLENKILEQANKENINLDSTIKDWIIKKYEYDVLAAACNCHRSHADYSNKSPFINLFSSTLHNNDSILSSPLYTVMHNVQQKPLPISHENLTHLVNQISEQFKSLNITDPIEQKQVLIEDFGVDIIELVNNTYKNRPDHKDLVNSFTSIDVHAQSINILNNCHDYTSVGQQFDIMAEHVFHNAKLCKLDFVPEVENHILDSIHIIKAPQNDAEFVFNITVVDHLLTDIQHKVDNIVEGKSTSYIERGSELFTRAIVKFIKGLNPVTQAKSVGELLQGAGHLAKHVIQHPINSLHTLREIDIKTCEFLVETAMFTSDTIFGQNYLTPEEYQQRCDLFWKVTESVSAEHVVDLVAQITADFAFGKGFAKAFIYLKEIDAASKLENYAAKIADKLKQAVDTHLADNPILVTAEGIVLKTSNDLKKFGEKIKNGSIGQKVILHVNNMKEFFELPFGQTLHPHSLKTSYQYQKFSIYKLTKNIPETRLKKGYFYYLDRLHGDHLEVFDKQLRVAAVYNLDGTFNMAKFEAAQQAGRTIKLT